MMSVIVHYPNAVNLALSFKTAFSAAKFFQSLQNNRNFNAHLAGCRKSAQGIKHIMTARHHQLHLRRQLAAIIQLVGGSVDAVVHIFSYVIGALAFHAVGDNCFIGFGGQTPHLSVVGAQNRLAALFNIA